jgi:hypothetical protein
MLEEAKGLIDDYHLLIIFPHIELKDDPYYCLFIFLFSTLFFINIIALAKDDGNDEDMAEMISYEIESLSKQLSELEDKLKVSFYSFHCFEDWDCKLQYFCHTSSGIC